MGFPCSGKEPFSCSICGESFQVGEERTWDRSGANVGAQSNRHCGECDDEYKRRVKESGAAVMVPVTEPTAAPEYRLSSAPVPGVRQLADKKEAAIRERNATPRPPVGFAPAVADLIALAASGSLGVRVDVHFHFEGVR